MESQLDKLGRRGKQIPGIVKATSNGISTTIYRPSSRNQSELLAVFLIFYQECAVM